MTSKEAIEIARNVFQFENGEETDEWSRGVIEGLKQAEKDLKILEILKKYLKFKNTPWSKTIICDIDAIRDDDYEIVDDWLEEALAKYDK